MSSPSTAREHIRALLADAPATMTVRQVAYALSVSERVVRRLLSSGELEGVKVGKEWRMPRESVLEYLEARTNRQDF